MKKQLRGRRFLAIGIAMICVAGVVFLLLTNNERMYQRADRQLQQGKYDEALSAFSNLKDYKDSEKRYVFTLAKQQLEYGDCYSAYKSFRRLNDFFESDLYSMYALACSFEQSGSFSNAAELFDELDTFLDSSVRKEENHKALYDKYFAQGMAEKEKGNFEQAINIFNNLGDDEACLKEIEACKIGIKDAAYERALKLKAAGDYDAAIVAFKELGDYRESPKQIEACMIARKEAAYQHAKTLIDQEKFNEAKDILVSMTDYKDCEALISQCEEGLRQQQYLQAAEAAKAGEWRLAAELYKALGDYKDSARLAKGNRKLSYDIVYEGKYVALYCVLVNGYQKRYGILNKEYEEVTGGIYKDYAVWDKEHILVGFDNGNRPQSWAIMNENGEFTSEQYQKISRYKDGWALVEKDDKYGYIGLDGKEIIPPVWIAIEEKSEDLIAVASYVKKKKMWGYISLDNELVIQQQFLKADSFHDGLAAVQASNGYHIIDVTGESVFSAKSPLVWIGKDRYRRGGNGWGSASIINAKTWEVMDDFNAMSLSPFSDVSFKARGLLNDFLVDYDGNVLGYYWEKINDLQGDYAIARAQGKYAIIDKKGDLVVPWEWKYIDEQIIGEYVVVGQPDDFGNIKYGIYQIATGLAVEAKYDTSQEAWKQLKK